MPIMLRSTHVAEIAAKDKSIRGLVIQLQDAAQERERLEAQIIAMDRCIKSLRPDALKYRERCRRDREHAAKRRGSGSVVGQHVGAFTA